MKVVVPSVGESVTEVTLSRYIANEGSFVKEGDPLVEIESDKASMEVPAPVSGSIHYKVKVGDTLTIGSIIGEMDTAAKPSATTSTTKETPQSLPELKKEAPLVLSDTNEKLRSSKEEFIQSLQEEKVTLPPLMAKPKEETQERKAMSKLRKVIAKRLVQVKNETAMLTTFNEVDMKAIMAIREREKEAFQKRYGAKLTFLPFFVKAVISALKEFPDVNAYIDGEDIIYNQQAHIGIAVSIDTGLVVPVIKNANDLSFVEITKTIGDMALKARDRKLSVEDMTGGTFTITNGGVFGSMLSTPILNPPQSAILGMHNIVDRPVAIDGKIEIRPIMYLALSYDHRVIDGKESVSFLVHVKKLLEDPSLFILGE
jgi:2-oxoglutarate dehydrogenase E2 component (dihydrolipoamide succinyltransferase)